MEPATRRCHPFKIVMECCHNLDLYCCYELDKMDDKKKELEDDLAVEREVQELIRLAEYAIVTTGDRLCCSHTGLDKKNYDDEKFPRCSQSPAACITAIQSALDPLPTEKEQCLTTSEFKKAYDICKAPAFPHTVFNAVEILIEAYCADLQLSASEGEAFLKKLHKIAYMHLDEVKCVSMTCMRLWTCEEPLLDGRPFYSIINQLLRLDKPDVMSNVVIFCRGINTLLVTRKL